jgi:CelD/BcsL family acetyltransferase involved in cellulose biosynthesis
VSRARGASLPIHDEPIVEIDPRSIDEATLAEWQALVGERAPFGLPGWFRTTAEHLATPLAEPLLLCVRRAGMLAAALPILVEKRAVGGIPARVYRSLSDDHSPRFDLAARDRDALLRLKGHLAADRRWDVIELREVADGDTRAAALCELLARDGFPTARWASQRSPFWTLPPTVDALDREISAKLRANLRRRARNLASELGPVTLELVTGGDTLDGALADAFALEASGWKGAAGTAIAHDARLAARYRAIAGLHASRGELAIYFLRAGERRVACHFSVENDGIYHLLKPGYDERLARHGIGQLLTFEVARDLVKRGLRELDFLGADLSWKYDWTSTVRPHSFHYVFRPSLLGHVRRVWKFDLLPLWARARRSKETA